MKSLLALLFVASFSTLYSQDDNWKYYCTDDKGQDMYYDINTVGIESDYTDVSIANLYSSKPFFWYVQMYWSSNSILVVSMYNKATGIQYLNTLLDITMLPNKSPLKKIYNLFKDKGWYK